MSVKTEAGSTDKPQIDLNVGLVTTTGLESYGLFAQNNGSVINASNLSVTTDKDQSYAVVAYNGGQITLDSVDIDTFGLHARGISVGEVRSEEHTSELQSLMRISYAVFCLKKKNKYNNS